jgi:hypothetical protein
MNPERGAFRVNVLSMLALVVLCGSILGLSDYSGHHDMRSGGMGTTSEGLRAAIAVFDLSQGEKIHYEWESNYLVRFVITTDPYHPHLAEYVNFTSTQGEGLFVSPLSSKYYAQVTFIEIPASSEARVDYVIYAVTEFSESIVIGKPLILGALTASLAGLLLWNWSNSKVKIEADVRRDSWTFWRFFVVDYKNWIAVVVGAVMLTFYSIISMADSNHLDQYYLVEMLSNIGIAFVVWGLIFGLWISRSNYKARK